jgi:hypothetical protein
MIVASGVRRKKTSLIHMWNGPAGKVFVEV